MDGGGKRGEARCAGQNRAGDLRTRTEARRIAQAVVGKRLAACVSLVLSPSSPSTRGKQG